jgi:hypothetical protein
MTRKFLWAGSLSAALLVAACGGGSGGSTASGGPPPTPHTLTVTIDQGPTGLASQNLVAANTLYASVTLCTPGSTSACQVIDHIQVDTQSVGLEILAEVLNGSATPTAIHDPATSLPVFECVTFADGYTWGSMVVADVTIGGRTLAKLPVHLIGDAAAGSAPPGCVSGPPENTVVQFGANGVIGIGNWLQDCGPACATGIPTQYPPYYACSNAGTASQSCTTTTVALANQMQNPVGALAGDNNGIKIVLPAVSAPGASSVTGTLYFGVGTQSDNALGSATVFTVDGFGYLLTTFGGVQISSSFIDSGSNAYFFADNAIPVCPASDTLAAGWDCPVQSMAESARIQGQNGKTASAGFTVDNAHTLFALPNLVTAYPTLGGPNSAANGVANSFDWGLPFFFGRTVYVLFENNTATGPAFAF